MQRTDRRTPVDTVTLASEESEARALERMEAPPCRVVGRPRLAGRCGDEGGTWSDEEELVGAREVALFDSHVAKENELILPVLAAQRSTSLAGVLDAMHAHMDASVTERDIAESHAAIPHDHGATVEPSPVGGAGGDTCGCHETDGDGYPELDARAVPHAIRHATVFGTLDAVPDGSGMVLVTPHDPLPLLAQIEQRHPGVFDVRYLERGPRAWRLLFERGAR